MQTLDSLRDSERKLEDHLARLGTEPARVAPLIDRLYEEIGVDGNRPVFVASAPGRTELAGNHTDHNRGRVLAASVDLDTVAAVAPRNDMHVSFASEGFARVDIDLSSLEPRDDETESTASLVRGVASALSAGGRAICGFDAAVSSRVAAGSGLSSSASIEVLVGTIFNHASNADAIGPTEIAVAGQIAENRFFGKPSGLMDQLACATGGVVSIDFANDQPAIDRLDVTFATAGLALLVVDTGGDHADLTAEYAAIPSEMGAVAARLGARVLGEISASDVLADLKTLRSALGDRAVARALHFFGENERVAGMVAALRDRRFDDYLRLMADSGRSSGMFLQNCAPHSGGSDQSIIVALALTERFLESSGLGNGHGAACRVHGGGFAGTIQVLLPAEMTADYRGFIGPHLGAGAVTELHIRSAGALAW